MSHQLNDNYHDCPYQLGSITGLMVGSQTFTAATFVNDSDIASAGTETNEREICFDIFKVMIMTNDNKYVDHMNTLQRLTKIQ